MPTDGANPVYSINSVIHQSPPPSLQQQLHHSQNQNQNQNQGQQQFSQYPQQQQFIQYQHQMGLPISGPTQGQSQGPAPSLSPNSAVAQSFQQQQQQQQPSRVSIMSLLDRTPPPSLAIQQQQVPIAPLPGQQQQQQQQPPPPHPVQQVPIAPAGPLPQQQQQQHIELQPRPSHLTTQYMDQQRYPQESSSSSSLYHRAPRIAHKELASPDEMFEHFQNKLKSTINIDYMNYVPANNLQLLDNEFKLLTTTNGIYAEPKIVENLKSNLMKMDPKLMDKLTRRTKNFKQQEDEFHSLKLKQIQLLREVQLRKFELLEKTNTMNFPALKLEREKALEDAKQKAAELAAAEADSQQNNAPFVDIAPKNGKGGAAGKKKKSHVKHQLGDVIQFDDVELNSNGRPKRKRKARVLQEITSDDIRVDELTDLGTTPNSLSAGVTSSSDGPAGTAAPPSKKKKKSTATSGDITDDDEHPTILTKVGRGRGKGRHSADSSTKPKINDREQKALDKQYDNTYISIWKDLARKDGPKAYRLFQQSTQAKQINLRKTSMLAARESKRWQLKTNKNQKDLTTKARRSMREMLNFWKKNEREERNLRQKAEQEAISKAKKEEDEREAKRQARKLNFLINQTELYSHFIGKKIKTSELEGDMGDKSIPTSDHQHSEDEDDVDISHAKKDFNLVDFDADDESLQRTAAANAQSALMEARQKAKDFNNGVQAQVQAQAQDEDDNDGEMNFQNPTSIGDMNLTQPKLLNCTLKEYQLKGLNWLANLYEQGINGILADEMGLGKTVQSISVLAYLAETHNIWGPFLVVTPASTLHNWHQEIQKFVPDLHVLPYWGTSKDRKTMRKTWDRKSIVYKKNHEFHVVVTSYQLAVADAQYFQKMKWQYMILDEAQAIKSSQSARWRSLLSFQCRNRLLLTGTPIQNSMQELWALLHFIMPSLFDSHDEFSEWFSKDIESHAQSNTQLNGQQLRRLHAILKPFMLRRIKKNVQSELGDKIEIDVYCDLTNRQKQLYRMLKSQINIMDLIDNNKKIGNDDDNAGDSLMNVVMQFRKVCNHPDLFERADTLSPFSFSSFAETSSFFREANESLLELKYSTKSLIEFKVPKLIHDEILSVGYDNHEIDDKRKLLERFNIWDPKNISNNNDFSFLRLIDQTPNKARKLTKQTLIENTIDLQTYSGRTTEELIERYSTVYGDSESRTNRLLLINKPDVKLSHSVPELTNLTNSVYKDMFVKVTELGAFDLVSAPPIEITCSKKSFNFVKEDSLFNSKLRESLFPLTLNNELEMLQNQVPLDNWPKSNLLPDAISEISGYSSIRLPSMKRFVIESGKLAKLDEMLVDLKKGDHKCLIYFQMTKMMDLMEEFLTYRQYRYIRLDGSSKLGDRRDLVHDWQTKPELFIFLLSTRAGGLGINLTAADTVIFYDSDWNPTIDSQAMDRAHRLGQTRQVTVYRLLVRNTIEERMRDRAKQKEHVQQVVMEGKASVGEDQKESKDKEKKEMAMWLLDDDGDDHSDHVIASGSGVVSGNSTIGVAADGDSANGKIEELVDGDGDVKMSDDTAGPRATAITA